MKLLLDTHIILWWMADDPRLKKDVRDLISSPENVVFVSAVTIWEIEIKKRLGKLSIPDNWFGVLKMDAMKALRITWEHAHGISGLPDFHRDPFDRLLVAQASLEGLTLVTHDKNILKYDVATLEA